MDPLTQVRLTREVVDIDSTTGREGEVGAALSRLLRERGYNVIEQPVSEGRFNVYGFDRSTTRRFFHPFRLRAPVFRQPRGTGSRLWTRFL